MKLKTIILTIGILSFLVGCKTENRYTDKHGNVIIEKGDETFIIPAEYEKTGESYKIFFLNKTNETITVEGKFNLNPNQEIIYEMKDTDSIQFNFGAKLYFADFGLERDDNKNQLAGIGGKFWQTYNVPNDVEYGFVIRNPGEGDVPNK